MMNCLNLVVLAEVILRHGIHFQIAVQYVLSKFVLLMILLIMFSFFKIFEGNFKKSKFFFPPVP